MAQPPYATSGGGFCRETALGSFLFLKACQFGNISGPTGPESSQKAFLQRRWDGSSTSIRIMLMDAAVAGRLNFNRRWLSLAAVGGWQQD